MLVPVALETEGEGVVEAEGFAGLRGGYAGVGGEAIEVVEAGARRPGWQGGFALLREMLLERGDELASARIARGNGTAGTRIAAFEMNFADGETDDAAFVFAEELIFPERGDAIDFERGTETPTHIVQGKAGEVRAWGVGSEAGNKLGILPSEIIRRLRALLGKPFASLGAALGKPIRYSLEGSGGGDGRTVGDGIVGKTAFGIAHDNLLLEKDAEPFGGFLVFAGEVERARGNFAAVARDREGDGREVGGIVSANEVNGGSAFAIDPFAVDRIEGPGAIESEAAGGGDLRLRNGDRVERFDGVETNVGEIRFVERLRHEKSLAGVGERE